MARLRSVSILVLVSGLGGSACSPSAAVSAAVTRSSDPALRAGSSPSSCDASANNVPTYRGDSSRTGRMAGPAPASAPSVRWQLTADGPLTTAPAVGSGTVFQGSAKGTLYAIDLLSGSRRWAVLLRGALTSTAIDDRFVFVGSTSGEIVALDRATGTIEWRIEVGGQVLGAPALTDAGLVVASTTGKVELVDSADGHVIWAAEGVGRVARSPALSRDRVIVPVEPGELVALDIRSGAELWRSTVAAHGGVGTPAVDTDVVIAATGLDGAPTADRTIVALDLASGRVAWRWASPSGQVYTPALAGDRGFVVSEDGFVIALDLTSGRPAWQRSLDGPVEAVPTIVGGSVIVAANDASLVSLRASDGAQEWQIRNAGVPYVAIVACGVVLVPTNLGTLTAFSTP
jgi:outer membrane protein assembly factor BamB